MPLGVCCCCWVLKREEGAAWTRNGDEFFECVLRPRAAPSTGLRGAHNCCCWGRMVVVVAAAAVAAAAMLLLLQLGSQ